VNHRSLPPPSGFPGALAAALMMLAAPVMAQTNVTSNGREGQTTCIGQVEQNTANMPITALSTTSVTVMVPEVTWSQVLAPIGDGQRPASAPVFLDAVDANTGLKVGPDLFGLLSSTSVTIASQPVVRSSLSAKSLYYLHYYAAPAGSPLQTLGRRCFMTGGTYTMTVNPGEGRDTSGCFSISPRTIQDVRNCFCRCQNNQPLFSSTSTPTQAAFRQGIGCR